MVQARETLRNEPRHDRLLAHAVVLAILGWLPVETVADAALVAALLAMPEAAQPGSSTRWRRPEVQLLPV